MGSTILGIDSHVAPTLHDEAAEIDADLILHVVLSLESISIRDTVAA